MGRLTLLFAIALVVAAIALVMAWMNGRRPGAEANSRLIRILAMLVLALGAALLFLLGRSASEREPVGGREPAVIADAAPPKDAAAPQQEAKGGEESSELAAIPAAYLGTWAPDRPSCRAGGETTRIEIGGEEIRFYESRGKLRSIAAMDGGREHALTLAFSGEGQSWDRTIILRRVGHEMTLRDEGQSEGRLYIRC